MRDTRYMDIGRVKINARYQPLDAFARALHRCASCIAHIQGRAELSYVFRIEELT